MQAAISVVTLRFELSNISINRLVCGFLNE